MKVGGGGVCRLLWALKGDILQLYLFRVPLLPLQETIGQPSLLALTTSQIQVHDHEDDPPFPSPELTARHTSALFN